MKAYKIIYRDLKNVLTETIVEGEYNKDLTVRALYSKGNAIVRVARVA